MIVAQEAELGLVEETGHRKWKASPSYLALHLWAKTDGGGPLIHERRIYAFCSSNA